MSAEPFLMDRLLVPGAIRSVMQPVFDLSRGTPSPWGVECLSRGPAGSDAEGAGLLFEFVRFRRREAEVDRICIETALRAAAQLQSDAMVGLNVHASTLSRHASFAPWLLRLALEARIAPACLVLEIVEHCAANEAQPLVRALVPLRAAGVRVAIDDVGTGLSTLRLVVELAPEFIKIDRFFVADAATDPRRRAVIEGLVTLARGTGAAVVAEGIENRVQLSQMFSLGIRLVQGFFLCEPLAVEDLRGRTPALFEAAPAQVG